MKTFRVTENCNLKDFTAAVYPQGGFCLAALLKNKDVKVNGVRVKANCALAAGDEVIYYTNPAQESRESHYTVYEDENVYVADKLCGVSSEGLLSELSQKGAYFAVHRLDTNTRGLIIFAKNAAAERELLAAFKERQTEKRYIALCKNNFKSKAATLCAYLKKDSKTATVQVCDAPKKGLAEIITEYKVTEVRGDIALVEIELHTGKTHQIRAHMSHIGCPVLGDGKYGDRELNKKYGKAKQQLISAHLRICRDGILSYLKNIRFDSRFTL